MKNNYDNEIRRKNYLVFLSFKDIKNNIIEENCTTIASINSYHTYIVSTIDMKAFFRESLNVVKIKNEDSYYLYCYNMNGIIKDINFSSYGELLNTQLSIDSTIEYNDFFEYSRYLVKYINYIDRLNDELNLHFLKDVLKNPEKFEIVKKLKSGVDVYYKNKINKEFEVENPASIILPNIKKLEVLLYVDTSYEIPLIHSNNIVIYFHGKDDVNISKVIAEGDYLRIWMSDPKKGILCIDNLELNAEKIDFKLQAFQASKIIIKHLDISKNKNSKIIFNISPFEKETIRARIEKITGDSTKIVYNSKFNDNVY